MSKPPPVTTEQTHQVRDHCLCLATQRAARTLARRFDDIFRPLGITSGQFSLLNALNRAEPPALGQVAKLLAMDRTTLTAALKPLARRGLVDLAVDPDDRRLRRLALTPAGREVLAAALPLWRSGHAEIDAALPGGELAGAALRASLAALA